ncbi:hypothetical protein [Pseudomonas syringae]|uniref:Uncharacterized protein n=1 Tax=Pseudomonas syringae TaxID=317 RepID=A0A085V8G0_PSESX|nr:hypothetical protein [Pseudomonas syringae]KFE51723.1 hypothetical protein IV02_11085 [Pseudomonas syringae]
MRRAYLDCEFTSLDEFRELISLALVVPGGPEFYVEIEDGWVRADCSNFVQGVVLPLLALDRYGRPMNVARDELQLWLRQFDDLEIISDAPQWDWPLFIRLVGPPGLPKGISAGTISYADIALMGGIVFPHHALEDARLIASFVESLRNRPDIR